jgi:HD-GYP domain-containing protein (c-di-GMP phosphodiesterase class II)
MTTNRPYQSGMDLEFAMNKILELAGTKFDPVVVDALDRTVRAGKIRLTAVLVEV